MNELNLNVGDKAWVVNCGKVYEVVVSSVRKYKYSSVIYVKLNGKPYSTRFSEYGGAVYGSWREAAWHRNNPVLCDNKRKANRIANEFGK